ncbi:alpha/beta hydrolase [Streptomyces crystallinus]|uniref:Alpha/beta fold hydrolase n=1 Tax=Streptomyces crystallinus TaxID=68191 RepID=A0ABP3QAU1_9ACTN
MSSAVSSAIRYGVLVVAATGVALSLTGCHMADTAKSAVESGRPPGATSGQPLPAALSGQPVAWRPCAAPTAAQGGGGAPGRQWECATVRAPLDYAKPEGETLGLALIRGKAVERGGSGALLLNVGGPGKSGVAALPRLAAEYSRLHAHYDLVGFDARGVGESAGVRCLSDADLDDQAAIDALDGPGPDAGDNKRFAAACRARSGKLLPHMDTESAARDLDLIRQVLREKKLTYFGASHGSKVGAVYAHLFPKNVGRMVLDAAPDPGQDALRASVSRAEGLQLALEHFLRDCAASRGARCPTGTDPAEGNRKVMALLGKLDQRPLPAQHGRTLTRYRATQGMAAALNDQAGWKQLAAGLDEAMHHGRGAVLSSLADSGAERDERGRYSNAGAARRAITCADDKHRYSTAEVQRVLPRFRQASPAFGEPLAWTLAQCSQWPVPGKADTTDVRARGAAPIVVIGNTGDPVTPAAGAAAMARQLGDKVGVHLTLRGEGHGAYHTGNACITGAVDSYLIKGTRPRNGLICG